MTKAQVLLFAMAGMIGGQAKIFSPGHGLIIFPDASIVFGHMTATALGPAELRVTRPEVKQSEKWFEWYTGKIAKSYEHRLKTVAMAPDLKAALKFYSGE